MSSSLINAEILARLDQIRQEFATAKPFRHVVIDNFLKLEVAEEMLARFPTVTDPSKLLNEFGDPNPKSAIAAVRSLDPIFQSMDDYIQAPEFLDAMSRITGIADLRYDPWYYGAGTHENFHTAGLDAHYDFNIHPHTAYHRRLNAIVYLNKDWDPAWRGDITFHTDPWDLENDVKTRVQPEFNRCVVFETTENSWHSVTPVDLPPDLRHLSRKSFTIYLYTETRPPEETAPEHGTVYVQAPLPERIQAGRTLDDQDMADINANLQRRQNYLRALYKREYKFSTVIDGLKRQISELKASSNVPVMGRAKVTHVASSLFHDNWMGAELRFTLQLRQDLQEIAVNVWLPDGIGKQVELRLEAGGSIGHGTAGGGMTQLKLPLAKRDGDVFEVALFANPTRSASESDERQVSVIFDSIELN